MTACMCECTAINMSAAERDTERDKQHQQYGIAVVVEPVSARRYNERLLLALAALRTVSHSSAAYHSSIRRILHLLNEPSADHSLHN